MHFELIAEVGSNHNGDVETAKRLVDVAADAGASSVKFQFIFAKGLYIPEFLDGNVRVPNRAYEQRLREELSEEEWCSIWRHAQMRGVTPSASVFCDRGIELLRKLGSPYVKIASTDLTNTSLISAACRTFDRVILSTGMSTVAEVDRTLSTVDLGDRRRLTLMHCVSAYPCPLSEANTQRIGLLRSLSGLEVGFSDHTEGVEAAMMALVQGARVFEKHFTLDKNQPGFDHRHALEPAELRRYLLKLSEGAESLLRGPGELSPLELVTRVRARRGRYASRSLRAGDIVSSEDLLYLRPGNAAGELVESSFVGQVLTEDIPQYASISTLQAGVSRGPAEWRDASRYWNAEMVSKGM